MGKDMVVFLYVLLCLAVCGGAVKFIKTTWAYFVVASFVPPFLMVAGDSLWHGTVSAWANIVAIVLFAIALGVALVIYLVWYVLSKRAKPS